jgi:hypothetical protein
MAMYPLPLCRVEHTIEARLFSRGTHKGSPASNCSSHWSSVSRTGNGQQGPIGNCRHKRSMSAIRCPIQQIARRCWMYPAIFCGSAPVSKHSKSVHIKKLLLAPWNTTESVSNQRPPKAQRPGKAQRPDRAQRLITTRIQAQCSDLQNRPAEFRTQYSHFRLRYSDFMSPSLETGLGVRNSLASMNGLFTLPHAVTLGNTSIGAGKPNAEARRPHSNAQQRNTHTTTGMVAISRLSM